MLNDLILIMISQNFDHAFWVLFLFQYLKKWQQNYLLFSFIIFPPEFNLRMATESAKPFYITICVKCGFSYLDCVSLRSTHLLSFELFSFRYYQGKLINFFYSITMIETKVSSLCCDFYVFFNRPVTSPVAGEIWQWLWQEL